MSTKIYVGNLSFNVQEDNLRDIFAEYGSVASCKLITDHETGRSKGFAFVEMGTSQEAKSAISSLDGSDLDGRTMKVNEAKPKERRERSYNNNSW